MFPTATLLRTIFNSSTLLAVAPLQAAEAVAGEVTPLALDRLALALSSSAAPGERHSSRPGRTVSFPRHCPPHPVEQHPCRSNPHLIFPFLLGLGRRWTNWSLWQLHLYVLEIHRARGDPGCDPFQKNPPSASRRPVRRGAVAFMCSLLRSVSPARSIGLDPSVGVPTSLVSLLASSAADGLEDVGFISSYPDGMGYGPVEIKKPELEIITLM